MNFLLTPLHCAAKYGHLIDVQYLISYGAEPNEKDQSGKTPYNLAVDYGHYDVQEFLGNFISCRI